jgi:hypothetical protein
MNPPPPTTPPQVLRSLSQKYKRAEQILHEKRRQVKKGIQNDVTYNPNIVVRDNKSFDLKS